MSGEVCFRKFFRALNTKLFYFSIHSKCIQEVNKWCAYERSIYLLYLHLAKVLLLLPPTNSNHMLFIEMSTFYNVLVIMLPTMTRHTHTHNERVNEIPTNMCRGNILFQKKERSGRKLKTFAIYAIKTSFDYPIYLRKIPPKNALYLQLSSFV